MASINEKLFDFLDNRFGTATDTVSDYENPEEFLRYVIESVGEQDNLTQGCGVGPLMGEIEEWIFQLNAGQRAHAPAEPFCLQIKFSPEELGFELYQTAEDLVHRFPRPLRMPESFPVFARKEDVPVPQDVLTYLDYSKVWVLP